jgi:hypothetical protein
MTRLSGPPGWARTGLEGEERLIGRARDQFERRVSTSGAAPGPLGVDLHADRPAPRVGASLNAAIRYDILHHPDHLHAGGGPLSEPLFPPGKWI